MFEQAAVREGRNVFTDWILRAAICGAFLLFGMEKFPSGPDNQWVRFFQDVGFGQWFRYFTGVVEMVGGILVLLPWTVVAGLFLTVSTMAGAALIHVFVLRHPGNAVIPCAFVIGLAAFWRSRVL